MTLYTSLNRGIRYLTAAILAAGAGAVYELFSHGVYSYFMIYAFLVPLAGGALPNLLVASASCRARRFSTETEGNTRSSELHLAAIDTLTAGCFMKGVLEIYGTTNRLMAVYAVLGLMLLTAAIISYIVAHRTK